MCGRCEELRECLYVRKNVYLPLSVCWLISARLYFTIFIWPYFLVFTAIQCQCVYYVSQSLASWKRVIAGWPWVTMNSNHSGSSRRPFSRGAAPRNHRHRQYTHNNPHSHNDNYQQQRNNFGQWYKDSEPCYSHG